MKTKENLFVNDRILCQRHLLDISMPYNMIRAKFTVPIKGEQEQKLKKQKFKINSK